MTNLADWLSARSQYLMNAARAILALAIGFKWLVVTPEQVGLILGAMESVFGVITAKTTVSHTRVDHIVEKRVNDIVSTPSEVAARGTGTPENR